MTIEEMGLIIACGVAVGLLIAPVVLLFAMYYEPQKRRSKNDII